jgi:glycosyltransferase involved in cell wall biosynthesis
MKIALIGRYGEGDILPGPERVARELYKQLKKKNVDVTFIEYFFSGYNDYSFLRKIFGSKVNEDGILRLGILPLTIKLLREQFDVIHFINSQRFSLAVFFIKPLLKAKFLSTLHGLNKIEAKELRLKRKFLDVWVEKITIKKSDLLIFPSAYLIDLFMNYYSLAGKNEVIHNGISDLFFKNRISFIKKDVYNFIYFHSFNKGLDELINHYLKEVNLPLRIFAIGKDITIKSNNRNIEIINVSPMNHFSLIEFLSDKHFIIKSSFIDSFSIISVECMAMGIIPIVSENIGVKEIIDNKINGFIYNSNDKENLLLLLRDIYEGKYNLQKISLNASKTTERLSWENVSEKYIQLYKFIV